jgi:hypothetical protein
MFGSLRVTAMTTAKEAGEEVVASSAAIDERGTSG